MHKFHGPVAQKAKKKYKTKIEMEIQNKLFWNMIIGCVLVFA